MDLFYHIYGPKLLDDFEKDNLDEDGNPIKPNEYEKMTADEALLKARQTGSDIFQGGVEPSKEWKVRWDRK